MPRIRREAVPPELLKHLIDRRAKWRIQYEELMAFQDWLLTDPEVPEGDWFKSFQTFFVCGHGELVKTFLPQGRLPLGEEIR